MAWIGQIQSFLQREHWGCVQQTALQGLGRGYEQGPKGNGHTFESCRMEPRGSTGSLADAIRVPFALRFVPNPRP
jgi:hypothetical protein